jgi:hypothetical protein
MVSDYPQWLQAISENWGQSKDYLESTLGIDNDLVHVLAGPLVQLFAALITWSSVQRFVPWLVVLLLELLNEWHDLVIETWPVRYMQYGEGLKDILLTMLLPTVILLLTRNYPHWFRMKQLRSGRRRARH